MDRPAQRARESPGVSGRAAVLAHRRLLPGGILAHPDLHGHESGRRSPVRASGAPPESVRPSRGSGRSSRRVVDVGPCIGQELLAVGFRRGLGAGVGRRERLDALGDDQLGLGDECVDHLGLGHDAHHLAPHEQVALAAAGGDAEVGVARLARTVDDAAHHRDLQRDVAVLERVLRVAARP